MAEIKVYTKGYCPYCVSAKNLLQSRGLQYREISVEEMDPEEWSTLMRESGMKTVPQIFFGDRLIGGFTDLQELDHKDGLDSLKT